MHLYALVVTPYIDGFTNHSLPVFDCINYAEEVSLTNISALYSEYSAYVGTYVCILQHLGVFKYHICKGYWILMDL